MTDVTRPREHNSNPLQAVIRNSKTALLFLAVVLPNDSPRTMLVNRGTLSGIPNVSPTRLLGNGIGTRALTKSLARNTSSPWQNSEGARAWGLWGEG